MPQLLQFVNQPVGLNLGILDNLHGRLASLLQGCLLFLLQLFQLRLQCLLVCLGIQPCLPQHLVLGIQLRTGSLQLFDDRFKSGLLRAHQAFCMGNNLGRHAQLLRNGKGVGLAW